MANHESLAGYRAPGPGPSCDVTAAWAALLGSLKVWSGEGRGNLVVTRPTIHWAPPASSQTQQICKHLLFDFQTKGYKV